MSANRSETYIKKLQDYCTTNRIEQPTFQDYSDPRGIRTAWSSSVIVGGREYRAHLWRDFRYLEQSREEAAEAAYKAILKIPTAPAQNVGQYAYDPGYGSSK